MLKSKLKKLLCGVLATSAIVGCAGTLSACETSRPEMQMKLSFNGQSYTLNYELYRKIAPATVSHFMKLVENDYYDGMCVHNYTSSKMYSGVYSYDSTIEQDNGLVYKDYYTLAEAFGVPTRVFEDEALTKPTYTLYGEFHANGGFSISNGDFLKQTFGSLTMYYTEKTDNDYTAFVKQHSGTVAERSYELNSATSEFFISLSTSSTSSSAYCTFATLKGGSADALNKLKDAIADYIDAKDDEDYSFTESVEMVVDQDDPFIGGEGQTVSYALPKEPIVIEYITITKY